ncbi:MAG: hypothetical protein CVU00_11470 [Bacteroidetes bacterium HGW-Bacteroidetes-17]|nr:MAG: hypothetical protein CVU00_11470 [Bacteroidetes bacterium HGW-Bacteroidetes-17]
MILRMSQIAISMLFTISLAAQMKINLIDVPSTPELFESCNLSTGMSERDFALSPDGTEIFYTLQSPQGIFHTILYSRKDSNGRWTNPEVAPFTSNFSDLEPAFSPDGSALFFSSNRPTNGTEIKDFDIWMVKKKNGKWGNPTNIGAPVNTEADEFYPSITKSGNLYFTAAYKTAIGKEDIYVSHRNDGKYLEPVPLDSAINTVTYEFNAFVSPEEDFIIFTSYGRKDDMGRGDLYMSIKDNQGNWIPAKHLELVNSNTLDYCPFVSFDKKGLFFTSEKVNLKKSYTDKKANLKDLVKSFTSPQNGGGDIYWVSFTEILKQF